MNHRPIRLNLPKAPTITARALRHQASPALASTVRRDIKSPMAGLGGGGGTSPGGGGPGGGGVNPGGGSQAGSALPVAINCARRARP